MGAEAGGRRPALPHRRLRVSRTTRSTSASGSPSAPGSRVTVVGSCGILWHEQLEVVQADQHRTDGQGLPSTPARDRRAGTVRATAGPPAGRSGAWPCPSSGRRAAAAHPARAEHRRTSCTVDWEWQRWERSGNSTPGTPEPERLAGRHAERLPLPHRRLVAARQPAGPRRADRGERASTRAAWSATSPAPTPAARCRTCSTTRSGSPSRSTTCRRCWSTTATRPGSRSGPPTSTRRPCRRAAHPPDLVSAVTLIAWPGERGAAPGRAAGLARVGHLALRARHVAGRHGRRGDRRPRPAAGLRPDPGGAPEVGGRPGRLIRRWHFRTSRYRDVREILTELGLDARGAQPRRAGRPPPRPRRWPTLVPTAHDDRAFDNTLSRAGHRPVADVPQRRGPRPSGCRRRAPARTGALAGVLLEGPEPIAREGRITVSARSAPPRSASWPRPRTAPGCCSRRPPAPWSPAPTLRWSSPSPTRLPRRPPRPARQLLGGRAPSGGKRLMSRFAPSWALSAAAVDSGGDPHLQPGVHLRVLPSLALGLPVAPLLVRPLRRQEPAPAHGRDRRALDRRRRRALDRAFDLGPASPATAWLSADPGNPVLYAEVLVEPTSPQLDFDRWRRSRAYDVFPTTISSPDVKARRWDPRRRGCRRAASGSRRSSAASSVRRWWRRPPRRRTSSVPPGWSACRSPAPAAWSASGCCGWTA